MDIWKQQSRDLAERRHTWEKSQDFDFITTLLNAENEEEVKGAYIRQFSLPVHTAKRHDLTVKNVLFEFKYSVNFKNIAVAAKVIAQSLYYIHRLFEAGQEKEISHFIIADKDEAIILKTSDFDHFYRSDTYNWKEYRPSSPDPKLIEHIKQSRVIESNRVYIMTHEDEVNVFSNLLYRIIYPSKALRENSEHFKKSDKNRINLIVISVLLLLLLGLVPVLFIRYQSGVGNKQVPIETKP